MASMSCEIDPEHQALETEDMFPQEPQQQQGESSELRKLLFTVEEGQPRCPTSCWTRVGFVRDTS